MNTTFPHILSPFFITEEWIADIPIKPAIKKNYPDLVRFDIFKNPSKKESEEISNEQDKWDSRKLRGFVDRGGLGDLYVWTPDVEHLEVMRILKTKMKGEIIPVYLRTYGELEVSDYSVNNLTHKGIDILDVFDKWKAFWEPNLKKNKNIPRAVGENKVDIYMPFYEWGWGTNEKTIAKEIYQIAHEKGYSVPNYIKKLVGK